MEVENRFNGIRFDKCDFESESLPHALASNSLFVIIFVKEQTRYIAFRYYIS